MSAEALLRDRDFRQDARRFLQHIRPGLQTRIPVAKPDPRRYRIVFGILGTDADRPGEDLPFFSQLNLARTSQALSELGYKIGIVGIPVQ